VAFFVQRQTLKPQNTLKAAETNCEKQSRSQVLSAAFWVCCGFSVCLLNDDATQPRAFDTNRL